MQSWWAYKHEQQPCGEPQLQPCAAPTEVDAEGFCKPMGTGAEPAQMQGFCETMGERCRACVDAGLTSQRRMVVRWSVAT